ncbi:MAG: DUF7007 domain-containing protein [Methyloceanibacter sp.]
MSIRTPWGNAQTAHVHAEGIVFYSTASHGGFKLDRECNALVHSAWRNRGAGQEEDCEAAKVIVTFPALFSEKAVEAAHRTLKNWFPDAYEQIYGVTLVLGESIKTDEQRFRQEHTDDWIVISAIASRERPGFVECLATKGGVRGNGGERRFLIPADEYRARSRFGFVIDEARHTPCDGPRNLPTRPR